MLVAALSLLMLTGCGGSGAGEERSIDAKRSFIHQTRFSMYAADTEDTLYFVAPYGNRLSYVDKETGIGGPLCGKPECDHKGKDCNAYVYGSIQTLFVDGDRLYWIGRHYPASPQMASSLFSTALDGTDRQEVELAVDIDFNGSVSPIWYIAEGRLYISRLQEEIEDGVDVMYQKIMTLDLDGGASMETVLDERLDINANSIPMQFYGGWLYFMTCEDLPEPSEKHFRLRRWSPETGETETLYDETNSERMTYTTEMWVGDEDVLFTGYSSNTKRMGLYRYSFESGGIELICDSGVTGTIAGGLGDGIITGFTQERGDEKHDFHVVIRDFEGQTILDETYELDLQEIGRQQMDEVFGAGSWPDEEGFYWSSSGYFLGRDENNAYYSVDATYPKNGALEYAICSIIQVPLDGSGAKVLCTTRSDL